MSVWTYPVLTGLDDRPIVVAVHDGDTVRLLLDCGVEGGAFPWLRVRGVQCPELGKPGGDEATAFTVAALTSAKKITVHVTGRSFARWVAQIVVDGRDLADDLIAAGHGVRYPA